MSLTAVPPEFVLCGGTAVAQHLGCGGRGFPRSTRQSAARHHRLMIVGLLE
jgi:hypothetical protein